jgi:hypothetical protein
LRTGLAASCRNVRFSFAIGQAAGSIAPSLESYFWARATIPGATGASTGELCL